VQTVLLAVLISFATGLSSSGEDTSSVGRARMMARCNDKNGRDYRHDIYPDRAQRDHASAWRRARYTGGGAEFRLARADPGGQEEAAIVFYTANFAEVEQEVIKAFNKRLPTEIKVEMVRAHRRPAHHPASRPRPAAGKLLGRRGQSLRPRPDARDREPVHGLRAAECGRLSA
jgi:hypothetical protein